LKRFRLSIWAGSRLIAAICVLAFLYVLAGAVPALLLPAHACAVLLAAFIIADIGIGPPAGALRIERLQIEHFALRVPARLRYRVTNTGNCAVHFGLIETPAFRLHYDIDELRGGVAARSYRELERAVTPLDRGEVRLGELYAWFENPIGLLRRRTRFSLPAELRIYPDLSAVQRYGRLHVRNRLIEAGLRKMRLRGTGTEFESLREYASGDQFRAIDWKATAKRGKLMIAQYEVERSQNIMLVLDCGRLMTPRIEGQRKLDYAVTAALSVATIAGLASDKVGFLAFANGIITVSAPRPSRIALALASEQLYGLQSRFEESDYSRAFGYLRNRLHKRSLIVFFTDMFDPVASAALLAEIGTLAKRHMIVCVFMNDAAVESVLAAPPAHPLDVYSAAVAATLSEERRTAATILGQLGVRVVDVPAPRLSVSLIDAYLEIKQRALL